MNKTQIYWHLYQSADPAWIRNNPEKWGNIVSHLKRYGRFVNLNRTHKVSRRKTKSQSI
jgi:hypothetical protein